jgi:hypothetical protein
MNKIFLAAAALGCLTGGGVLAEDALTGTVKPFGSVPFAPDRDVACLASALETGDPLTGPSTWILKAPPGCVVPWHSHTAEEQLIIVRGVVRVEMTAQHEMTDHSPNNHLLENRRCPREVREGPERRRSGRVLIAK